MMLLIICYSDVLLVSQADTKSVMGRLPAKLFEYIGVEDQFTIEKDSDLEKIISKKFPSAGSWILQQKSTKAINQ